LNKVTDRNIPLSELRSFKNHPYKVEDNIEMDALCESISKSGLFSPIIVRTRADGEYEIISGHRRYRACQKLGYKSIAATVFEMSDEEAIVAMVDSNLHRERVLPSEKAFSYKMKLDAIKRQGERTDLTSAQPGQRLTSVEKIAAESDESKSQVQRYISLTRLIPELLQMVDEGKIALTPAVELSKLHHLTQKLIYEICDMDDLTPSYAQTVRMRKLADEGALGEDAIREIMSEEKANQRERIVIYMDDIRQYYPRNILPKDIVADIKNLLHKRRAEQLRRKENRDAR
jgi:ParB family chromosome partitioning protein